MKKRVFKPVMLGLSLLAVLLVGFLGLLHAFFSPHIKRVDSPISPLQASNVTLSGSFPSSARNVYFAHSSVGLAGWCLVYRFEAPYEECLLHAQREFLAYQGQIRQTNMPVTTHAITQPALDLTHLEKSYGLTKLTWFDVLSASNGVYLQAHGGHNPRIWIDKNRNLLFFHLSD